MSKILWSNDLDDILYQEEYQYKLYDDYVLNADTPEVLTFDAWLDEVFYETSYEEYRRDLEEIKEDELVYDILPDLWNSNRPCYGGVITVRDNADWWGDVGVFFYPSDLEKYLLTNRDACLMVDTSGHVYEASENEYFYTFPETRRELIRLIKKCTEVYKDLRDDMSSEGSFTDSDLISVFMDILKVENSSVFTDAGVERLSVYLEPIIYKG